MREKKIFMTGLIALLCFSSTVNGDEGVDLTKIVVLELEFMEGSMYQRNINVAYNYPPDYLSPPTEGLTIKIYSGNNKLLEEYVRHDPRGTYVSHVGYVYQKNVNFSLILPYTSGMEHIDIYDQNNSKLISIDLTGAIESFCKRKNDICDPDCEGIDPDCFRKVTTTSTTVQVSTTSEPTPEGDNSMIYAAGAAIIVFLIIGLLFYSRSRREKQHQHREKRDEMLVWIEEQLRNGEDPEKLKTIVRSQDLEEELVDQVAKKLM